MDYQSRIQQIGGGKSPSKKVSEIVDDYEATIEVIADLQEQIDNTDDDDDRAKLGSDLDEMITEREKLVVKLDKALVGWENGIVRMNNMHQVMRNKTNQQPNSNEGKHVGIKQEAPSVNRVQAMPNSPEVKKKGYGWLVFGGIALILTMGAINTFKRD